MTHHAQTTPAAVESRVHRPADDSLDPIGDRHHWLWDASGQGCCAEGDLLALMPSVERADRQWTDAPAWIGRVLGF